MLPETIELEIVTPARFVLHATTHGIIELPGLDGYLGILPGHAPLITELGIGVLSYPDDNETHYLTIVSGYAEVLPDRVIVLAEISERAEEIDLNRAQAALERARERMARPGSSDVDWDRAATALARAMVRVQAAAKGGAVGSMAEEQHAAR